MTRFVLFLSILLNLYLGFQLWMLRLAIRHWDRLNMAAKDAEKRVRDW